LPTYKIDDVYDRGKYKDRGLTVADVLSTDPAEILRASKMPDVIFGQQVKKEIERLEKLAESQGSLF